MKQPQLLILLIIASFGHLTAQTTITLTFTAEVNGIHQPLDSILIQNLSHGGDTTLYPPDTVLVLDHGIGIEDNLNGHGNLDPKARIPQYHQIVKLAICECC
jgi:hypothetical protein